MTAKKQKKSLKTITKATSKKTSKKPPIKKTRAVSAVKKKTPIKTRPKVRATKAKAKTAQKRIYHKTKQIVVPTKSNDFIPLIIRRYGVLVVALIILFSQIGYNYMQTGQFGVLGRVSRASIPELIADTNEKRAANGASALVINDKLTLASSLKAQDMVRNNYWAHTSPTNVTPWDWLKIANYDYSLAGENLAKNFPDSDTTVNAWMESTSHRENMLNPNYTEVGFAVEEGVIDGKVTTVVVALYGKPSSSVLGENIININDATNFATSDNLAMRPLSYFGVAIQSLNPATIGALALLTFVGVVALLTYAYRKRLPTSLQDGWRKHHGLIVFVGVIAIGITIIISTGGGQML